MRGHGAGVGRFQTLRKGDVIRCTRSTGYEKVKCVFFKVTLLWKGGKHRIILEIMNFGSILAVPKSF